MTGTKVYRAWASMKTRCYNPTATRCYTYHGAMGVQVCDEWLLSFEAFYSYVGDPPTEYHEIDRIDPYGDYEPGNVAWTTRRGQMMNTRRAFPKHPVRVILNGRLTYLGAFDTKEEADEVREYAEALAKDPHA